MNLYAKILHFAHGYDGMFVYLSAGRSRQLKTQINLETFSSSKRKIRVCHINI